MSYLTRRPSLPSGYLIPGFPSVEKALHSDGMVEVYRLADASERILVLVPGDFEPPEVARSRLLPWWEVLGSERVVVERELDGASFLAVLRMKGEWLAAETKSGAALPEERELLGMLAALVETVSMALALAGVRLGEDVGGNGLVPTRIVVRPTLSPSLVWWDPLGGRRAAPIYVDSKLPVESELVRDAANLVYRQASGIDPKDVRGPLAPLSKWAKTAGPKLSGVLGRCLSAGLGRIHTIAEAKVALGTGGPAKASDSPAADRHGKGLSAVAGMRELRTLLEKEVVRPIRDPEPFKKYGLDVPNGILLFGPPGCGKTWIARKLAEEVGHYFVEIIPSEIASPYIHDSVLRIRELFDTAAERAPSIVFIDEFEALAPARADLGGHQQYKSEEVNEFLAQLNACAEKKIFVIAASNEPAKIDAAVRRTGRLDKIIYVGPPDAEARAEMLRMHLAKRPLAGHIDCVAIAATLSGYSASDIKFLVDQAARAALDAKVGISSDIVLAARSRIPPSVNPEDEARYKNFLTRG